MPKISVIIPLYNKEEFIKTTIDSILSQSFKDFEIIIINDGSKDKSSDIVQSISDDRIRLVNQVNKGVSAARNRGIAEAKGDYIFFLDADDTLIEDALKTLNDVSAKNEGADVLVASFNYRNSEGNLVAQVYNRELGYLENPFKALWQKKVFFRTGNMLIKRDVLKTQKNFDENLSLYEDLEWLFRLLRICKVYSIKEVILDYNRYEGGLSRYHNRFSKDFGSIAKIKNCSCWHERKLLGDFLMRRTIIYLEHLNYKASATICYHNAIYLWVMIYAFVQSLFIKRV